MVDVVDKATRSRMMSGIRGKNTRPETAIRKSLFARGYRYKLHDSALPGSPDMVFPKYHAVIFIHGCFWHGHNCAFFRMPSTNRKFWKEKIGGNRVRDARYRAKLLTEGWRVMTIWECAIRGRPALALERVCAKAGRWLSSSSRSATLRGGR